MLRISTARGVRLALVVPFTMVGALAISGCNDSGPTQIAPSDEAEVDGAGDGDARSPFALSETPLAPLAGNVSYFCWLDPDGTIHDCEFSCVDDEEWFDASSGTCINPTPTFDGPPPPGGPDGGGVPGVPDTVDIVVTLECGPPVPRGSTVTCAVSVTPSYLPFEIQRWDATALDFGNPQDISVNPLSGPAIIDDTQAHAYVLVGGAVQRVSDEVSVQPRDWSWEPHNRSTHSAGSSYNGCLETADFMDAVGHTVGEACTPGALNFIRPANSGAFSLAQVQSGPFAGVWYVESTSVYIDLVGILAPDLQSAGPSYPLPVDSADAAYQACEAAFGEGLVPSVMNIRSVNVLCDPPGNEFLSLVGFATVHEGRHSTLVLDWAELDENDLRAFWDPQWKWSREELDETLSLHLDNLQGGLVEVSDRNHHGFQSNSDVFIVYAHPSSYLTGQGSGSGFTPHAVTPGFGIY